MLYMTFKYSFSGEDEDSPALAFRRAAIANANRGGENVNEGALIGALLGAECGFKQLPADLVAGLAKSQRKQLEREIDDFVAASPFANL